MRQLAKALSAGLDRGPQNRAISTMSTKPDLAYYEDPGNRTLNIPLSNSSGITTEAKCTVTVLS